MMYYDHASMMALDPMSLARQQETRLRGALRQDIGQYEGTYREALPPNAETRSKSAVRPDVRPDRTARPGLRAVLASWFQRRPTHP